MKDLMPFAGALLAIVMVVSLVASNALPLWGDVILVVFLIGFLITILLRIFGGGSP